MTKHTPGPWRAYKMPMNPWWHIVAEGEMSRDVADIEGPGSAMIFNNPHQAAAVAADARLIAAAPDMLAALENTLAYAEALERAAGVKDERNVTLNPARAAIAKANGE